MAFYGYQAGPNLVAPLGYLPPWRMGSSREGSTVQWIKCINPLLFRNQLNLVKGLVLTPPTRPDSLPLANENRSELESSGGLGSEGKLGDVLRKRERETVLTEEGSVCSPPSRFPTCSAAHLFCSRELTNRLPISSPELKNLITNEPFN